MDLTWLETFLQVAKHGSFTRASEDLHLTQPGVSRQVQKLERELGVLLFERREGAVHLTAAGERLRTYAEDVLERRRRLLVELQGETTTLSGELRIAASTTPGEFLVPGLVARFTEQYPEVRPQVFITDSSMVVEELVARRWDVGFVGAKLTRRGLRYYPVGEDEVVLATPPDHPFAARSEVALPELEGQPFVEREGGSGTLRTVHQALAERGLSLPPHRTVMVLGTTQAVVSAVENGYGIGWVSSLALEHRGPGRVAVVRLAGVSLRRVLYLIHETRRPLPPVAAAFVNWARKQGRAPR